MLWRNNSERYGAVAAGLHWLIGLSIIGMICLGLYMKSLPPGPGVLKYYFWHKSIGITILMLAALRLSWRVTNTHPDALPTHQRWEKILANITHFLLYVAMFTMPLSGWIMSSAKGYPVSVFGWFMLPAIAPKSDALAKVMVSYHDLTAYTLIGIICLHLAGALKHHVIDRDNTLRRMLPFARFRTLFYLPFLLLAGHAAHAATPTAWTIDPAQSTIAFQWKESGTAFDGSFKGFSGPIAFDPDNLAASHVEIKINTKSIETKNAEKKSYITATDWLNTESFPESTFEAHDFKKTGENQYVANGHLTLKGVTLPIALPFTVNFTSDAAGHKDAKMEAVIDLKRLDYKIGDTDTASVENPVNVRISVVAHAAN